MIKYIFFLIIKRNFYIILSIRNIDIKQIRTKMSLTHEENSTEKEESNEKEANKLTIELQKKVNTF